MPLTPDQRDACDLRKHLAHLTIAARQHLIAMDVVMKESSTEARGREVARLANLLEMANDRARFFGLGIDFRTGKPRKNSP